MTNKDFNKVEFKREISQKDIMVRGKRRSFETLIKDHSLYELMYGNKFEKTQNKYTEIWDNFKTYN